MSNGSITGASFSALPLLLPPQELIERNSFRAQRVLKSEIRYEERSCRPVPLEDVSRGREGQEGIHE